MSVIIVLGYTKAKPAKTAHIWQNSNKFRKQVKGMLRKLPAAVKKKKNEIFMI